LYNIDMVDIKQFKLDYLYKKALLSEKQRKRIELVTDVDDTDVKEYGFLKGIENSIIDFVKGGENLYIHSSTCGNGKTSWAIRMVQSYFEQIWSKTELKCRALYISVPRYMIAIKDNISEKSEYIEHIKKNILIADIVIWDEVGTKGLTQFEHENIMSLINARIDSGKSNIYTSNLTDRELLEAVGKRLHSRISLTSHSVELKGKDKRGLKL
jgi:DNA replication protein DnaC